MCSTLNWTTPLLVATKQHNTTLCIKKLVLYKNTTRHLPLCAAFQPNTPKKKRPFERFNVFLLDMFHSNSNSKQRRRNEDLWSER